MPQATKAPTTNPTKPARDFELRAEIDAAIKHLSALTDQIEDTSEPKSDRDIVAADLSFKVFEMKGNLVAIRDWIGLLQLIDPRVRTH